LEKRRRGRRGRRGGGEKLKAKKLRSMRRR
jgi:hypothetical protein